MSLEISDSEAKVIQVQEIAVSNEAKAQELYAKVANEGADFAATARKESENPDIEVSVGRGERDAVYEEPVFALEAGEISEPFLWQGKWYVVKCVSVLMRTQHWNARQTWHCAKKSGVPQYLRFLRSRAQGGN